MISEERRFSILKKDSDRKGNQFRKNKTVNFESRTVDEALAFSPNDRGQMVHTHPSERSSPLVSANQRTESSAERRNREEPPQILHQQKLQVRKILTPKKDENSAPDSMQSGKISEGARSMNREQTLQSRLLAAFPPRSSSRENSVSKEKKSPRFETSENRSKSLYTHSDTDSRAPLSEKTQNDNSQSSREPFGVQSRLEVVEMSLDSKRLNTPAKNKIVSNVQHKTASPMMKENIDRDLSYHTAYKLVSFKCLLLCNNEYVNFMKGPNSNNLTELQTKLQSLQESKTKLERRMRDFEQKLKETEKD